jgi:hypothetical protein
MNTWISLSVAKSTKGRMRQADSPCPTQGDAAATTASAPDMPIVTKKKYALEKNSYSCTPKTQEPGNSYNF